MTQAISVTGSLAPQERSLLSAKVAGRLQFLSVDLGSTVKQGDVLAQIDPTDYELRLKQAAAALAQARSALGLRPDAEADDVEVEQVSSVKQTKAVLEEATRNRERVLRLTQSGVASQSELDTAEAAYKVALSRHDAALEEALTRASAVAQRRAEYELARKQLSDASLRAPFAGAVQSRPANPGEYVAPGTAILELVKIDPLRLRLQVPERESSLVRTGQVVRLFVEGDTNAYTGHIARLSPGLDEQIRMLLVEADVPKRGSLRPGLFARAQIILDEQQPGLSVPASALVTFAGIEKVITVAEGKAKERVIETGRRGTDWVEVVSGLGQDELVVVNPEGLRTGQPVRVVDAPTSPTPAVTATQTTAR
jgi:RND family efflux transporter MFP subunit